jgi:4'-phosphopantetheinyl transferase
MGDKAPTPPAGADTPGWPLRASPPLLEVDEPHLWAIPLEVDRTAREALSTVLCTAEHARARRLIVEAARARFVESRAALRLLLAAYAQRTPRSLAFGVATRGKPFLENPGCAWLRFNLAHSDGLALVGVARGLELGVDVERLRVVPDALEIASRYFAPSEAQALAALTDQARSEAFLQRWTRKEAALKATGEGLGGGLDSASVDEATREWSLHALEPAPGYVGALAVLGRVCRVHSFTLSLEEGARSIAAGSPAVSPTR